MARCDCGTERVVPGQPLRNGQSRSCGCYVRENNRKLNTKHGQAANRRESRAYHSWYGMKTRCYNHNMPRYRDYGARGITVCDRWKDSFENFFADMGPRPDGRTLDRIDNDGNYEPGNCRWATPKEQASNRRRRVL